MLAKWEGFVGPASQYANTIKDVFIQILGKMRCQGRKQGF
jgi:hypothetical protein